MDDRSPDRPATKLPRFHNDGDDDADNKSSHDVSHISIFKLILPFLEPAELAAVASTCKSLSAVARTITSLRSSDATRGMENYPIPFINVVDNQPYSYFIYSPVNLFGSEAIRRQGWGLEEEPCDVELSRIGDYFMSSECGGGCDCKSCGKECPCQMGFEVGDEFGVWNECGKNCRCGEECGNRKSQKGISVRLRIVKDVRKGWGLYAAEGIRCGEFVCEYAGELLTTNEARRRQHVYDQCSKNRRFSSALLVVREHLPSGKACLRINIDATRVGSVGRFINHSCDGGNLSTVLVRTAGALLPRLCFFASTDVAKDDELTFSYGSISRCSTGMQCFCGSSSCVGLLPSEAT